jgi:pantothenate kinase type III
MLLAIDAGIRTSSWALMRDPNCVRSGDWFRRHSRSGRIRHKLRSSLMVQASSVQEVEAIIIASVCQRLESRAANDVRALLLQLTPVSSTTRRTPV